MRVLERLFHTSGDRESTGANLGGEDVALKAEVVREQIQILRENRAPADLIRKAEAVSADTVGWSQSVDDLRG